MILNFKFDRHFPLQPFSYSIKKKKMADARGSQKALLVMEILDLETTSVSKTRIDISISDIKKKAVPQLVKFLKNRFFKFKFLLFFF
jgi:hypothetical protein